MESAVMEKLLAECERAYWSKYPVLFIQTEELELIRRIILSNRLVVRMREVIGEDVTDKRYEPCPVEESPYVRYIPAEERELDCLQYNVTVSKRLNKSYRAFGRMPCVAVAHISGGQNKEFPSDLLMEIMRFADCYTRDANDNSALRSSLYLLYGDSTLLPVELQEYCAVIDVPLPEVGEICGMIRDALTAYSLPEMHETMVYDLAFQLLGFSLVQVEHILTAMLSLPDVDGMNAIYSKQFTASLIAARKRQLLHRQRLLTLRTDQKDDPEIGGMEAFNEWFVQQAPCIRDAARMQRESGVLAPRGVLMCGIPGCGKSLAARYVARELDKPLLQMDVGNLMGSLLGESEKNMDQALRLAEAMSPCVLWIDELDKGFSAASGKQNGDSGAFKRMFGKLLTWMQENKKPCFIFATANDITSLPKEFFRSGRFDELFAVHMPLHRECGEILRSHMRRVCRATGRELFTPECWDSKVLDKLTGQFIQTNNGQTRQCFVTGADIEKLVNIAMRRLWREKFNQVIDSSRWEVALLSALRETQVYGESAGNLDEISISYLRMLRNGLRPSAKEALFDAQSYYRRFNAENNSMEAGIPKKTEAELARLHPYDRALYEALWGRIQDMAPVFEKNAREYMLRGG